MFVGDCDYVEIIFGGIVIVGGLCFLRCAEEVKSHGEEAGKAKVYYNVEFTFDTDARVAITIYYQATEEFQNGIAR